MHFLWKKDIFRIHWSALQKLDTCMLRSGKLKLEEGHTFSCRPFWLQPPPPLASISLISLSLFFLCNRYTACQSKMIGIGSEWAKEGDSRKIVGLFFWVWANNMLTNEKVTKTKGKCRVHSPYTLFSRQNPRTSFKMAAHKAARGLKDRDDIPLLLKVVLNFRLNWPLQATRWLATR